ncbi:MAG: hypothetical protein DCC75_01525 [Proteobacteria bacterium]|nr:MAG: hypothetical protein DCC75_01525 [Pseudomonadota bacterium]
MPSPDLRYIARARTIAPLIPFMPGFLAGQLLTHRYGALMLAVALFSLVLAYLHPVQRTLLASLALSLAAGLASGVVLIRDNVKFFPDITYLAEVEDFPHYSNPGEIRLNLAIFDLHGDFLGRASCRAVHLPWRNSFKLERGSITAIRGSFQIINRDPAIFSYDATLRRRGVAAKCRINCLSTPLNGASMKQSSLRQRLVASVKGMIESGEQAGLVLSMSLGIRDAISEKMEDAFRRTGLSHLLVFSGYQITLFYLSALWLLNGVCRALVSYLPAVSRQFTPFIALLLCSVLLGIIGFETSSVRALIALCIYVFSNAIEYKPRPLNALCLSLIVLCLIWPGCFLEPGVQLTFSALIGLSLAGSGTHNSFLRYLLSCSFATSLASIVSAVWFGGISLMAIPANLLLGPLLSLVACQGGLLSIAAMLCGLDPQAYLLRIISEVIWKVADLVQTGAAYEWAYVAVRPNLRLDLGMLGLCAAAVIVARTVHNFRMREHV